jgi:hypothetical protein
VLFDGFHRIAKHPCNVINASASAEQINGKGIAESMWMCMGHASAHA